MARWPYPREEDAGRIDPLAGRCWLIPDAGGVEDARQLAQSLADLTEPTALFGLGVAERATILNFAGPVNP